MCTVNRTCLSPLSIVIVLLVTVTSPFIKAETRQLDYSRSMHDYKVPNVNVTTQTGSKTALQEILSHDQSVIVNFIFTSCNAICPIMTAILSKAQAKIGDSQPNLRFVSISIDPENDHPALLSEYAKKFKARKNWTFLTGELADIQAIQIAFDAYRGDKMNHTSLTLMRASGANSWLRIDGLADADHLISEFESMMLNSSSIKKNR